jgi:exonuclease SbcD
MKFAHLADVHLGGWREPKLRDANTRSFCAAIAKCIAEKVDFVLIAGDLFNTSLPSMDSLKIGVQKLKELQDAHIPAYIIPGSHDFSPSGKTMIDVLESAGLVMNVARGEVVDGKLRLKFTVDAKTGCKLTGMIGKKGGLEKHHYYELQKEHLEAEKGPKVFLFHSPIAELKPEELAGMDAMAISLLPQGFDYYAGGHVHVVQNEKMAGYTNVVYPGPMFPNNFAELEKLECGSFVIWDNGNVRHEKIKLHPVVKVLVDAQNKSASEVNDTLEQQAKAIDAKDAIVLLRVEGVLKQGRQSDINFNAFTIVCNHRGAYIVLRNTSKLESKEFQEIKVSKEGVDDIEDALIKEHAGQLKLLPADQEAALAKELMRVLAAEKDEGERVADFEKRIAADVDKLLGL